MYYIFLRRCQIMVIKIISGESETDNDIMKVCEILSQAMHISQISRNIRFTPLGEEKDITILLRKKKEEEMEASKETKLAN